MKTDLSSANAKARKASLMAAIFCLGFSSTNRADTVELTNGDHYSGKVLSVSLSNVSLRSEAQGLIVLPREKVAAIGFSQTTPKTNSIQPEASSDVKAKVSAALPSRVPRIPATTNRTNLVSQVQDQLLADAGPEATEKFNQMARDLLTGKLSVPEIRRQAQEALKAVESAKQDFGPEMDGVIDGYLSILRDFLKESAAP